MFFAVTGLAILLLDAFLVTHPAPHAALPAQILMSLAACVVGFVLIAYVLRYKLVLDESSLEIIQPFQRRSVRLADLSGWRQARPPNRQQVLILVPRDARAPKIRIPIAFKTDATFEQWYRRLPNLDAREMEAAESELASARYLHLSPDDRTRQIKRLKDGAKAVLVSMGLLVVASALLPDSHHVMLALLIVFPWVSIALVARFQPLYRFGAMRSYRQQPDLTAALILPGIMLTLPTLEQMHTLSWQGPLSLALAGGVLLSAAAFRADPAVLRERWGAVLIAPLACIYGFGAGMQLNAVADRSPAHVYDARVSGKRIQQGSHSTREYLRLEPWGPFNDPAYVRVSDAMYRASRVGDTVCPVVRAGALGVAWFHVENCRAAGRR